MKIEATSSGFKQSALTLAYTVDSFANGIAFGQHKLGNSEDPRDYYSLHLQDGAEMVRLRSRYVLNKINPLFELERNLMRLSNHGLLRTAAIYFGTSTDPFFPFEGKFDASMKFLELFTKYTPGMLIVQTRSPLIVIGMPILRRLGSHTAVTIGIETCLEDAVRRYTPGLPRIEERLKAATALRNFNVEVTLQVSPILPYGDWRGSARSFAEVLDRHADFVYVRSITDGSDRTERRVKASSLAKQLARDRKFHWLRPDSANPLISALEEICPDKVKIPVRTHLKERQISIFAA